MIMNGFRRVLAGLFAIAVASLAASAQTTQLRLVSTAWPPFTNEAGQPRFALDLVEAALGRIGVTSQTLIVDAAKFTPAHGEVEMWLTLGARDNEVMIVVRDSGVGIPADKLELIFEPFVQLERSLTLPSEGAGLGLAISRDLARGMGGDLRAESVEGQGATLILTLPRAIAPTDTQR